METVDNLKALIAEINKRNGVGGWSAQEGAYETSDWTLLFDGMVVEIASVKRLCALLRNRLERH